MGAPFPLLDLSLSVMVTTTSAQHKRFARQVPQLLSAIHSAMGNDKGAHCQLEAHGNAIFYAFISRDLPRNSNTR